MLRLKTYVVVKKEQKKNITEIVSILFFNYVLKTREKVGDNFRMCLIHGDFEEGKRLKSSVIE